MREVLAYHVILGMRGFWLPNDPRGSGSKEVRAPRLRQFGAATFTTSRRSVAGVPHDTHLRQAAKQALKYGEVVLTGVQARSIGLGFADQSAKAVTSFMPARFCPGIRIW